MELIELTKVCRKCGERKSWLDFFKSKIYQHGIRCHCKKCSKIYYKNNKEYYKKYRKSYYLTNIEKEKVQKKDYHETHKDEINKRHRINYVANIEKEKIRGKKYRESHKKETSFRGKVYYKTNIKKEKSRKQLYYLFNKEKIKIQQKLYREINKKEINIRSKSIRSIEKRKAWVREKSKTDYRFRLNKNMSGLINYSLKKNGGSKEGEKWKSLVLYTINDLKKHLEKLFQAGMSWNNYGRNGWVVDHIIPIAVFNFTSHKHEDFKRCWALKNLQPMWDLENAKKNAKIDKPFQPSLLL